jgi:hypothetical protein
MKGINTMLPRMNDMDLTAIGIDPTIMFRHDSIPFPYLVVWYSPVENRYLYQVFSTRHMAFCFIKTLCVYNRDPRLFVFHPDLKRYTEI